MDSSQLHCKAATMTYLEVERAVECECAGCALDLRLIGGQHLAASVSVKILSSSLVREDYRVLQY
jgi:hypothetical protein